jgi:hypothetical protein
VALTAGATYHLVDTFDCSTLRIYVNGVEQGSAVHAAAVDDSTASLQLSLPSSSGWNGRLDEIAVYGQAPSAAQAQGHYSQGLAAELTTWSRASRARHPQLLVSETLDSQARLRRGFLRSETAVPLFPTHRLPLGCSPNAGKVSSITSCAIRLNMLAMNSTRYFTLCIRNARTA